MENNNTNPNDNTPGPAVQQPGDEGVLTPVTGPEGSFPSASDDGTQSSPARPPSALVLLLILSLLSALILLTALRIGSSKGEGGKASPDNGKPSSLSTGIPDGEPKDMGKSKRDSYRERGGVDSYFDALGEKADPSPDDRDMGLLPSGKPGSKDAEAPVPSGKKRGKEGEDPVSAVFGKGEEISPGGGTRSGSGTWRNAPPSSRPAPSADDEDRRLEYDRKRAEMVRDILSGREPSSPAPRDSSPREAHAALDQTPVAMGLGGDPDGIITSLDDYISSDGTSPRVRYSEETVRPLRCMFVRDGKIRDGQRVTLRLLEDYTLGNVRIPGNTHLSAMCRISDRLQLSVRSVEVDGRIVPLSLEAYDMDGIKGIYCPDTSGSKASREVAREAVNSGSSLLGGLVGDLAGTVIRTGATLARNATGEVSINVVSGYEFYLAPSQGRR